MTREERIDGLKKRVSILKEWSDAAREASIEARRKLADKHQLNSGKYKPSGKYTQAISDPTSKTHDIAAAGAKETYRLQNEADKAEKAGNRDKASSLLELKSKVQGHYTEAMDHAPSGFVGRNIIGGY